jgi:hypothetical protein
LSMVSITRAANSSVVSVMAQKPTPTALVGWPA